MVIPSSPDSAIREEPPPAFCRTNPSPEPSPLVVRRLNHSTLAVSSEWGTPLSPADRLQCNPTPERVPQNFTASVLGTIEPLRQPVSAKQTSGAPGVDTAYPINLLLFCAKGFRQSECPHRSGCTHTIVDRWVHAEPAGKLPSSH